MINEAVVKKKRVERVNAVSVDDAPGEVDTVSRGAGKDKAGVVCANHLRFPGNCYRCFNPEKCLLKDAIIPVSYTHLTLPTTPYV